MKRYVTLAIIVIAALCSCNGRKMMAQLDEISKIADDNPDSALTLLSKFDTDKNEWGKGDRMHYELIRLKAESVGEKDLFGLYYDYDSSYEHGLWGAIRESSLLKCTNPAHKYHLEEAPEALQAYYDAISMADTTNTSCDFRTLTVVYGQMSRIFHKQNLPHDEIWALRHYVEYIRRNGNLKDYIMETEQLIRPYYLLNKKDSVLNLINNTYSSLKQLGEHQEAADALVVSISIYLERGDLTKAKHAMDIFEKESGLFDEYGNIAKGREHYYYTKGLYELAINQLGSAEYYFRKELRDGKDFNNQNAGAKGLTELYQRLHQLDSAAKYSLYAYDMNDSMYARRATKDIERIQGMYNYTRHQEIAHKESQNATKANIRFLISLVVLLIVFLVASWLYIARRKVIENLEQTASELHQIKVDNYLLKQDVVANQQQITDNEKRIKKLESKLGKYGKLVFFGSEKIDNNLKLSPNYQQIEEFAYKGQKLSDSDWDNIRNLVSEYYPGFYDFLLSHLKIDTIEYHICLLLRLHFKAGEIANMLGVTPPYISKTSTEMMANLYGKKGSSKELSKELGKINC